MQSVLEYTYDGVQSADGCLVGKLHLSTNLFSIVFSLRTVSAIKPASLVTGFKPWHSDVCTKSELKRGLKSNETAKKYFAEISKPGHTGRIGSAWVDVFFHSPVHALMISSSQNKAANLIERDI
jgi:hypothetical protein